MTVSFSVLCMFRSIIYSLLFSCLVLFFNARFRCNIFDYFTTVMFSFLSLLRTNLIFSVSSHAFKILIQGQEEQTGRASFQNKAPSLFYVPK